MPGPATAGQAVTAGFELRSEPRARLSQPSFSRVSAPDWVNAVMVEIQATMPAGATAQQVPEMLHTLLEERFGLVTRREARPMDAHELAVAPGGMKM